MDKRILDPEGARERLEAWKGRIDKVAADTKAMSDRFQALQVTATDRAGMVEVTVDSSGALVGLRLTDKIERVAPTDIASTIMDTIRQAKAELADRSQEIIEETVGTESPAAREIAERVGQHLRAGDDADQDDHHSPAGPSGEAAGRGDNDDDEPFELRLR